MSYTTVEAARIAGVSVRMLRHWEAVGYLRAQRTEGHGTGYASQVLAWDEDDIEAAAYLGAVSRAMGQSGANLMQLFAHALAVPHGDNVGVSVDSTNYTVTVEVRPLIRGARHGTNHETTQRTT